MRAVKSECAPECAPRNAPGVGGLIPLPGSKLSCSTPPGHASAPPLQSTPLGPFLLCSAAARPEASSCWQSPHSGSSVGVQGAEPEEYMLWGPERTPGGMRWARTESWRVFGVSAKDAVEKGSPWEPPNSAFCVIKGFSWRVHKVRGLGKSQELRV